MLETGPSRRLVFSKHGERHNRVGQTNRRFDARQLRDGADGAKIVFRDGKHRWRKALKMAMQLKYCWLEDAKLKCPQPYARLVDDGLCDWSLFRGLLVVPPA